MITATFFTDFLKISNLFTVSSLVSLFFLFWLLKSLKKKISFSTRMLLALVFGLILGLGIDSFGRIYSDLYQNFAKNEIVVWYSLVGSGVLRLIQLLAIPVVFLSIIIVLSNVKANNLKSLTLKTFAMLLGTTAIASLVAIGVVNMFNLSAFNFTDDIDKGTLERMDSIASQSFPQFFLDLVPNNIFNALATNSSIVSVVIIAALFASSIRFIKNKNETTISVFTDFIDSTSTIVNSVLKTILKLMPYGVSSLVALTIVKSGVDAILSTLNFIVALYVAVFIMLFVYVIILLFFGISPIRFYKHAFTTMLFAFSSRSSLSTLPYTISTLENKLNVSKQTSNFVATLGTTIGMNGCAGVFPAMLSVVLAKAVGIPLDISFYVLLVTVVTLGSIGIAGVPGTATVAATVTLNGIGLGSYVNSVGAIFGIDPILDMGRTMLNVTGSMVSAVVVDKLENKTLSK